MQYEYDTISSCKRDINQILRAWSLPLETFFAPVILDFRSTQLHRVVVGLKSCCIFQAALPGILPGCNPNAPSFWPRGCNPNAPSLQTFIPGTLPANFTSMAARRGRQLILFLLLLCFTIAAGQHVRTSPAGQRVRTAPAGGTSCRRSSRCIRKKERRRSRRSQSILPRMWSYLKGRWATALVRAIVIRDPSIHDRAAVNPLRFSSIQMKISHTLTKELLIIFSQTNVSKTDPRRLVLCSSPQTQPVNPNFAFGDLFVFSVHPTSPHPSPAPVKPEKPNLCSKLQLF